MHFLSCMKRLQKRKKAIAINNLLCYTKSVVLNLMTEKKFSFSYMYLLSYIGMAEGRLTMKEGIHPNYYQAKVVCNCGNEFVTGSTKKEIHVEICSKCHSFYTGQQKAVKARGAIDKFNRRYGIQAN